VKRVERNETADTVSMLNSTTWPPVSPNLSLRGAGGDAAISGRGDCFAFPPAALGEWLAMTRSRGTPSKLPVRLRRTPLPPAIAAEAEIHLLRSTGQLHSKARCPLLQTIE